MKLLRALLFLALLLPALAGAAVVCATGNCGKIGEGTTTIPATFTNNVVSGNTVIVMLAFQSTTATATNCIGTRVGTMTQVAGPFDRASIPKRVYYFAGVEPSSGSETITCTLSGAVTGETWMYEFSGLQNPSADGTGTSATAAGTPWTVGPLTPASQPGVAIVGGFAGGPGAWTAGSGWTNQVDNGDQDDDTAAINIYNSTSAITGTYSAGPAGNWLMTLMLFKGTTSGGAVNSSFFMLMK